MRRLLLGALLAAAGVFVTPAAAWAHAELVSSNPAYGDRLPSAPTAVRLDFSAPVDLTGARVTLQRRGGKAALASAAHASPDRRVVTISLPRLADGAYTVVWYVLGNDGHLMGGETPFSVGAAAAPAAVVVPSGGAPEPAEPKTEVRSLGPGIAGPRMELETTAAVSPAPERKFTIAVATPQAFVRLVDYASLAVLIGGVFFLARVWAAGTGERRAQRLLWASLAASAVATLLNFGLTAAGLQGVGALEALHPSVIGTVLGTRYSRIMTFRALFLGLGFVALAMLTIGRDRAVRSRWWQALAGVAGGGVVVTHALLGHVSNEGLAARLAVFVYVVGVSIWLGGLVFLAAVVLPRRRIDEVRILVPRFSRLAFSAVTAIVVAGAVMVPRVVPKVTDRPQTGYGCCSSSWPSRGCSWWRPSRPERSPSNGSLKLDGAAAAADVGRGGTHPGGGDPHVDRRAGRPRAAR